MMTATERLRAMLYERGVEWTATERLRAMLDERGVEWTASGTDTCWTSADGYPMRAWDTTNGTHMRVTGLTPEQAIAATLGSEREKQLELLVNQLWYLVNHRSGYGYAAALEAIEELGIEVDE